MKDTCENACTAIYNCGVLTCGGAAQLCPNFGTSVSKDMFHPLCLQGCNATPGPFLQAVDPSKCDVTITTLKQASSDFKTACGGT